MIFIKKLISSKIFAKKNQSDKEDYEEMKKENENLKQELKSLNKKYNLINKKLDFYSNFIEEIKESYIYNLQNPKLKRKILFVFLL